MVLFGGDRTFPRAARKQKAYSYKFINFREKKQNNPKYSKYVKTYPLFFKNHLPIASYY